LAPNENNTITNRGGHFNNDASQVSVTEDSVHSLRIKIYYVCHFNRISLTKDTFGTSKMVA